MPMTKVELENGGQYDVPGIFHLLQTEEIGYLDVEPNKLWVTTSSKKLHIKLVPFFMPDSQFIVVKCLQLQVQI